MYSTKAKDERLFISDGRKKLAGTIRRYGRFRVLEKHVRYCLHYHCMLDAWGVDCGVLESARQKGVTHVLLIDHEDGCLYGAPVEFFDRHGMVKDYGHGVQVFLGIEHWRKRPLGGGIS